MGKRRGRLVRIIPVDIHGSLFYDIQYVLESKPEAVQGSRIGRESVYSDPQPGDAVFLHLVLGQLTRVERAAE